MPVLKNARHERFIQGVVKGISPGPAYTAAGYEVTGNSAESAAARLLRNVQVKKRYAELMAPAIEATEATVERAGIGRQRGNALSGIEALAAPTWLIL